MKNKKKKDAASKKEAGRDAEHVSVFTRPYHACVTGTHR